MALFELHFSLVAEAPAPPDLDEEELERLADFIIRAERGEGTWEITVALVDGDRLQALHRDFMGIDTPTDIMTFPLAVDRLLTRGGDLAISVDHAMASAWGLSPVDEIRFLVAHGLLHLLDWNDEGEDERDRMLERQRQLIDEWMISEGVRRDSAGSIAR